MIPARLSTAFALSTACIALPFATTLDAQSRTRMTPAPSQDVAQRGDHRFRYMLGGAAVGGLLSFGYYQLSDRGANSGKCEPLNCALPYLSLSGAIFGLFLAKERSAQRRAESPRLGDAIEFAVSRIDLPSAASDIAVRDSVVVVSTDSGAQVFSAVPRPVGLRRRAAGLSNLRSVALSGAPEAQLLIGTGTALWETPLTTGLVSRLMDGPVDALAANGNTVVAAFGNKVRVLQRGNGPQRLDSVTVSRPVTGASFDAASGNWWLTSDSLLYTLTVGPSGVSVREAATFVGQARAVASSANWIAVALGSDGLAVWPRTALSTGGGVISPIVTRGEPRFAFDLAFVGDDLFVAGGVDGVTRVSLEGGVLRVVGSSRQASYATTITSQNGVLWVGDTNGKRVIRIMP